MCIVPKNLFADSLKVGQIYYLKQHKLNTPNPHYFIVIAKSDSAVVLFSCCTTQFAKRKRHIEINKLPFTTLVQIKSNSDNNLPVESYVDCNSVFDHTIDELYSLSGKGLMEYTGELNGGKIEEIKKGIFDSPQVEGEFKDIVAGDQSQSE